MRRQVPFDAASTPRESHEQHHMDRLKHPPAGRFDWSRAARSVALMLSVALCVGCGNTVNRQATEQLLASDAVDRTVAKIDFRSLAGKKVYFDTQHIKDPKDVAIGYVNSDYIISALRQQMVAASCRLQDQKEKADYVVEARVGTLGTDGHEVIYGIPANNMLGTVSSFVATAPQIPAIPEISFAKKDNQSAAAKIGVFAYNRLTSEPVWQSGIAKATSNSKNTYLFGVGPFQNGEIYDGTRFAGSDLEFPLASKDEDDDVALTAYDKEVHFVENRPPNDVLLSHNTVASNADTNLPVAIGRLTAVDANAGDRHTFELAAVAETADNAFFEIDGDRLNLKPGTKLDPTSKRFFSIRVAVSDGTATTEQDLTVLVKAVSEPDEPGHIEIDESKAREIDSPPAE